MKSNSNAASLSMVPFGTSLTRWLLPVKLFLFCHPQLAGYNDEVLDVKFLGPGDSHIVVATNSPQLKVFELATLHCQILYGHTGVCDQLWCTWVGGRCESISLSSFLLNFYVETGVLEFSLEQHHKKFWSCAEKVYVMPSWFCKHQFTLSRSVSSVPFTSCEINLNWYVNAGSECSFVAASDRLAPML